ncbi:hypothetical protein IAT40_007135 [Kwoniella sp. CBS 6097]
MPVTKKKGAIFAIYADSPLRGSSPPPSKSASSSSFKAASAPKSPSKRSALGNNKTGVVGTGSTRTVLSSLQPKAVKPSSASSLSQSSGKARSAQLTLEDGPLKLKSTISTTTITNKPTVTTQSKSQIKVFADEPSTKAKTRTKSSISVFSDENTATASTSTLSATQHAKPSSSLTKGRSALGVKADPQTQTKPRRTASSALAPLQPQSLGAGTSTASKRSRDLLSPLPILAPTTSSTSQIVATGTSSSNSAATRPAETRVTQTEVTDVDLIGESPAKRNRTSINTTPLRTSRVGVIRTTVDDKENVPPTTTTSTTTDMWGLPGTPDDLDGSPATRTRSKIRALTISGSPRGVGVGAGAGSPLRSSRVGLANRERRIESLVGDGRGTLTLKKGRELAMLMSNGNGNGNGNGENEGHGVEKKYGKGAAVRADGALVDVSEAYGASGDEPEGFRSQGARARI